MGDYGGVFVQRKLWDNACDVVEELHAIVYILKLKQPRGHIRHLLFIVQDNVLRHVA